MKPGMQRIDADSNGDAFMTIENTIDDDVESDGTLDEVAVEFHWELMGGVVGCITVLGIILFGIGPGVYAGLSTQFSWLASHYFVEKIKQGSITLEHFREIKISEEKNRQIRIEEGKARKKRARKRWDSSWRIWVIITVIAWICIGVFAIYTKYTN